MIHFIINPAGASGNTKRIWKKLEPDVLKSGIPYNVHWSSPDHQVPRIAEELTAGEETVRIVVIGGDGTINETINGFRRFHGVEFACIPCGSGNDLARDLELPKDLHELMARILECRPRRSMDIGRLTYHNISERIADFDHTVNRVISDGEESRLFAVSTGIGFDAETCAEILKSRWKYVLNKLRLGKMVYLVLALKLIFAHRLFRCEMRKKDGRVLVFDRCMFAAFMNHRFEGGGFMFCPDASFEDGQIDVCTVHDGSSWRFLKVIPKCFSGGHVKHKDLATLDRSESFEVRTAYPVWVHTDGEVTCRSSHISVETIAEKLTLLI